MYVVRICMYTYVICMYVCMCVWVCMYVCMHVCICIYVICICMYVWYVYTGVPRVKVTTSGECSLC